MKKLFLTFIVLSFCVSTSYAENWIENYGFYDNKNEISAKDYLIKNVNNIFDYEKSANNGGEKIKNGRYYLPIKYQGGNNGIDEDYIYVDELLYDDTNINTKINNNIKNIKKNKKKIKKIDNKHTIWNEKQDVAISNNETNITNNKQAISNNSNRIDDLNNRVNDLEDTQYIVGTEVRMYDSKKWQVNAFADYSTNRQIIDRTGIRFTYKIGQSYEEKRVDQLERKINSLLENHSLVERDNVKVIPTKTGFKIEKGF